MAKFYNKQRYSVTGRQHSSGESIASDILGASSALNRFVSQNREFDLSQSKELGDSLAQEMLMQYSQIKNATQEEITNNSENFDYGNNIEAFKEFTPSWIAIAKEKFGDGSDAFKQFEKYILKVYDDSNSFANKINEVGAKEASRKVLSTIETTIQNTDPSLHTTETLNDTARIYESYGGNVQQLSTTVTNAAIATAGTKVNPADLFEDGGLSQDKIKKSVLENFGSIVKYDEDGNLVPANDWVRRVDVARVHDFYSNLIGSVRQELESIDLSDNLHKTQENLIEETERLYDTWSQYSNVLDKESIKKLENRINENNKVISILENGNINVLVNALDQGQLDIGDSVVPLNSRQMKQLELIAREEIENDFNELASNEIYDENGDFTPDVRGLLRKIDGLKDYITIPTVRNANNNLNKVTDGSFNPSLDNLPSVIAELRKMEILARSSFSLDVNKEDVARLIVAATESLEQDNMSIFEDAQETIATRNYVQSGIAGEELERKRSKFMKLYDDEDDFLSQLKGFGNWGENIDVAKLGFPNSKSFVDHLSEMMHIQNFNPQNPKLANNFVANMFTKVAGGYFGGRWVPKPTAPGVHVGDEEYRVFLQYVMDEASKTYPEFEDFTRRDLKFFENIDFSLGVDSNGGNVIKDIVYTVPIDFDTSNLTDSQSISAGQQISLYDFISGRDKGVIEKSGVGITANDINNFSDTDAYAKLKKTIEKQEQTPEPMEKTDRFIRHRSSK